MNSRNVTNALGSFALLIVLIFCQFTLLSKEAANKSASFSGDEPGYVSKAEYFSRHGILPKADPGLEKSGWTDYRAPGYPVFIALCNRPKFDIGNIRWRCAVVQFVLMALALVCFYFIAFFAMKGSKWIFLVAFILGIQPWAFECCASLYADSLCASLAAIYLVFLYLFVKTKKQGMEVACILVSGVFLVLVCLMRTEMLSLAPPVAVFAVIIKLKTGRRALKHAAILGLIFLCPVGIQAGYRHYLTGKAELIPKYKFNYLGAVNWTQTWFNTEKTALDKFAFGSAEKKMENLPSYAFGDDLERKEIKRALSLIPVSGHTEEVDAIFQKVADKRVRDNFFVNCILTRMSRTVNLWLNLQTNAQLLDALSGLPGFIRKPILAGFLLLKILVYCLAITSFFMLIRRVKNKTLQDHHYLTLLAAVSVLLTTILIGLVLGSNEHRFVLKVWPAMLWCAVSAIIDLSGNINKKLRHGSMPVPLQPQ